LRRGQGLKAAVAPASALAGNMAPFIFPCLSVSEGAA
jgi:hypothetical protein